KPGRDRRRSTPRRDRRGRSPSHHQLGGPAAGGPAPRQAGAAAVAGPSRRSAAVRRRGPVSLERSPRRWDERYARVCRRHRDLVGVWGSPDGAYALLLSDTLVPLSEEHRAWLKRTRDTARAIMRELRASGLQRPMFVLQWWPYERI